MNHPRQNANGGAYINMNNHRTIGPPSNMYLSPDALSALSMARPLVPDSPFNAPQMFRNAAIFPPGVPQPPSRAMLQPDIPNHLLLPGMLPQAPRGLPLQPPIWNVPPTIPPMDTLNRIPGSMPVPSPSSVPSWERLVRPPAPVPSVRQQEQPLDLSVKLPAPPKAPEPVVFTPKAAPHSDADAPLDFSTKPRSKPTATAAPINQAVERDKCYQNFMNESNAKSQNAKDSSFLKKQAAPQIAGKQQSLISHQTSVITSSSSLVLSRDQQLEIKPEVGVVKPVDATFPETQPVPANKPPPPAPLPSSHSENPPAALLPAVTAPFPWFTYSGESRTTAVPEEAFQHVSDLLMPIVQINSVFDFIYNASSHYWPCLVCGVSRNIMQIRYVGAEPGYKKAGGRFWVEAGDQRMKPRGWGQKHKLSMKLPSGFELTQGVTAKDVVQMTLDLLPLSNVLIQHSATCCADLFIPGRLLEIQDPCDARVYWFARVVRNHCGRLCLHYVTAPEHETAPALAASPHLRAVTPQPPPLWLFASSRRLKPVGWARDNDCVYKAPAGIRIVGSPFVISRSVLECSQLRVNQLAFQARALSPPQTHNYYSGDHIDWLHPTRQFFCSAIVRRIVDTEHFVISCFNGSEQSTGHVATLADGECFPSGFAVEHNLAYRNEAGKISQTVINHNFGNRQSNADSNKEAHDESWFAVGRKLEIVVPNAPELITIATVVRLVQKSLVVVEVDASKAVYIFPTISPDLLPAGFAEMSKHSMTMLPQGAQQRRKQVAVVQPEIVGQSSNQVKVGAGDQCNNATAGNRRPFAVLSSPPHDAPASSPAEQATLLFSNKCFSGKLLSKSKVALLPGKIGPGDVLSVLKEALTYLLNTAYRPSQVLRILHVKTAKFCRREHSGFSAQQLKTRYGSKMYKATTVLCTNRANLPGYLRRIAHTLGYCPGLLCASFVASDGKQVERPPCSSTCRKIVSRPVTTRRAAAAAAASAISTDHGRRSPGKMLSVVVPSHSPHSILAPDAARRNMALQNQHDSSGGPSSATSDSRSPRSASPATMEQLVGNLPLSTNPLRWSVDDVTRFMQYHECGEVAHSLAEQEIDGPSLLLLNLAVIQDYLPLRMGPTLKLCRLLERLHIAFRQQLDLARDYFLTSSTALMPNEADLLGLRDPDDNNSNDNDGDVVKQEENSHSFAQVVGGDDNGAKGAVGDGDA